MSEDTTKQDAPEKKADQLRHRLGARLQAARLKKEFSLDDVAGKLRIRSVYLEEIESGDWQEMPEEVYALAFLRQYAQLLGEDIGEELQLLKTGDYHLTKPFTMPDPPIAPNRRWAVLAGVLFIVLFIVFNVFYDNQPDEEWPNQQQPVQPSADIPKPQQDVEAPDPTKQPSPGDQKDEETPKDEAASKSDAQTPDKPGKPVARTHRYRFKAVGESAWLQVFNANLTLIQEALLQPGESLLLENEGDALIITCGNAAALEIEVDGELLAAAGSLGESGKVLREFRVKPPAGP